jgi:SAM-dependent MidA family methyltransferase
MNEIVRRIRQEIQNAGPVTFARFMEVALYAPGLGYYERPRVPGRAGDFFTSVSVGPLFCQLLAFQFAHWLDAELPEGKVQIVEAGAHDGRLAADILAWLERRRPDLLNRLDYCLVDPSPDRRVWQEKTLLPWRPRVVWATDIGSLGRAGVLGVIFSNEFLDALPVHRLAWDAAGRIWREWRVAHEGETFVWRLGELSAEAAASVPHVPDELAASVPDGFVTEAAPLASVWWRTAAGALRRGRLMTIDYGLTGDEWFRPERAQGTLRAYASNHPSANLLANPGDQDLTAHVNFSTIEEAGRAGGLRTEGLLRQAQFLTHILGQTQARPECFDPWDQKRVREFQTLTHPEHLGERFRALIQKR